MSVWKPHATVAAIIEQDGRFLMVEENCEGQIVYNQPAGHLDPGESLVDAVIRETREETAWGFVPEYLTGVYRWDQPDTERCFLRFTFYGQCCNHNPALTLDEGIIQAVWLSRDELLERKDTLRSPLVLACIDDYLSGTRYPLELLKDIDNTA